MQAKEHGRSLRWYVCLALVPLAAGCAARSAESSWDERADQALASQPTEAMAAATLDRDAIAAKRVSRVEELLRGLPGVYVSRVGGATTVRVRGALSRNGAPLFVLDGAPLYYAAPATLADINPADVLRVQVLRSGAETAVWGSHGDNGVIVITTRRAR
ncbi:MAG: TonB-dependent receptor [Gemmatimonadaceae bacterium]